MTTHITSSQLDIVKVLQSVDEGALSTVGNFGKTISDPTFVQSGYDPTWTYEDQPTGITVNKVGTKSRDQVVKVTDAGLLHLDTDVVDANLIAWLFNPTTSKSFIYSYKVQGVETFRLLKACLPKKATCNIPNKNSIQISADIMVFQPQDEDTDGYPSGGSPPYLTSGDYADALTGTPWTHADGGSGPFTYNGTVYYEKGFSVSVDYGFQMLDPNGDLQVQWAKPSLATVTGSVTTFKKDSLLQIDAKALAEQSASRVLKSATLTCSLTGLNFKTHKYDAQKSKSDSTMEALNFEANSVAFA